MTVKVVHALNGIVNGGLEQGILTLIEGGFYKGTDFKIVELFRGTGEIRDKIVRQIGEENVISLIDRGGYTGPSKKLIPSLITKFAKVFRVLKPNTAVLSHNYANIIGRTAAIPFLNLKVIAFEHDSYRSGPKIEWPLRATSWRVDSVFGDTPKTLEARAFSYSGNQPTYTVPLVMLEPGRPRGPEVPTSFNVFGAGRLADQKNFGALVSATGKLIAEGRDVTLSIAGEGSLRGELETAISDLDRQNPGRNVKQRIQLLGWIGSREEHKRLLDKAHGFFMPSRNEGFCIALVEAMARGVPTAATPFAGVEDYGTKDNVLIIPGAKRDGLIFATGDDVAGVMRNMIDNYAELGPNLSRAGIATVTERFSPQIVIPQWQPAIKEVVSPRFAQAREPNPLIHPLRAFASRHG